MGNIIKKGRSFVEIFDDAEDFREAVSKRPLNKVFEARKDTLGSQDKNKEFAGTSSFEEAEMLFVEGDAKTCEKITNCDVSGYVPGNDMKITLERDTAGFIPCVPAYLAGQPRSMMRARRMPVRARLARVALNVACHSGIKQEDMLKAGVVFANVVAGLEKENIRVEVYCGDIGRWKHQKEGFLVKVKGAGEPLNVLRMAYPLCNPSFLRRHGFAWLERAPLDIEEGFIDGYGKCCDFDADILPGFKFLRLSEIISVCMQEGNDGAMKYVLREISE